MNLAAGPGGDFLYQAAVWAAYQVGLVGRTVAEVAAELGVRPGRLQALAHVLRLREVPPRPTRPPAMGWGRLEEVLRRDAPLDEPLDLRRYHTHLVGAGEVAARTLAARLPAGSLLDIGGGAGVYTRAFLDAHPGARATLVDAPEVLPLAAELLGERATLVAGDARQMDLGGHDVALLANVLHLHPPEACRALVARAAAAAREVVIVDLRVAPDRSGPEGALFFALNMALYTEGGTVYDEGELAGFLTAAGKGQVTAFSLDEELVAVRGVAVPVLG